MLNCSPGKTRSAVEVANGIKHLTEPLHPCNGGPKVFGAGIMLGGTAPRSPGSTPDKIERLKRLNMSRTKLDLTVGNRDILA